MLNLESTCRKLNRCANLIEKNEPVRAARLRCMATTLVESTQEILSRPLQSFDSSHTRIQMNSQRLRKTAS